MRRAFLAVAILFAFAAHAERWPDAYKRGLAAINAHNYDVAVDAMQHALAETPNENNAARVRNETIVYIPHYWIGVAKFNLGDFDGALRELKSSEEQGVIQNTEYYAKLRDWVARVNAEKSRAAQSGVADVRKAADVAVSHAMTTQMDALAAGADRSDNYRAGQHKLQEAMEQFRLGGSDARAYHRASDAANQARDLFASAADDARKAKAARPPAVVATKPAPQKAAPQAPVAPVDVAHIEVQTVKPKATPPPPQPQPVVVAAPPSVTATQPPIESEALVSARVALQQFRQRNKSKSLATSASKLDGQLRAHPDGATIAAVTTFLSTNEKPADVPKRDLLPAYRAFARGEIDKSLAILTSMIDSRPSAEALLLRGCAKYTAAMLAPKPDLASASNDFKAALRLNRALRLDRQAFSPKMVAFFEQQRNAR